MKASSAGLNGALAVIGLIAAWVTWQRPKESTNDDNVTVLEATKSSLTSVRYEDGERALEVFQPAGQKAVWLRQSFLATPREKIAMPGTALPDGGVVGLDGGEPIAISPFVPPPARELRGNERAESLMLRFTPFEAVRALGKLPADKQKELGLDGTKRKLTVTVAGKANPFDISNAVPGVIGTYMRSEDGSIYLLTGSILSELEPASQSLVDRRLHAFRAPDYDEFVLDLDGKKYAFLQKDAEIPQTMKVMPKATPDKPDDLVRNWHDKISNRLIVTEVLGKDENPKGGPPKVELRIDYLARGASKGFLELGKSGGELYARTENTASWVGLHTGTDDVIAEAKKFTSRTGP